MRTVIDICAIECADDESDRMVFIDSGANGEEFGGCVVGNGRFDHWRSEGSTS